MTASDEELAKEARDGDQRAFEALVRRHKSALYGLIRRYVGNGDDAYDVLQNTFAAAWTGIGRYDAGRSFAAWIRTVALNKCRDFARRGAVRRLFLETFEREEAVRAIPVLPAEEDPESQRLADLEREIAALAPALKEPLLLTTLAGLSHQEAALELGISVKAVEMRVYRARKLLAARMTNGAVSSDAKAD